MGFSVGNSGGRTPTSLSEINVMPLVDVMIVLFIIFMITASVDVAQPDDRNKLLQQQLLWQEERLRRLEEMECDDEEQDQQVPINLPKVNSEQVNLAEEQKLVLSIDNQLNFYLGETVILSCFEVAPELQAELETDSVAAPAGFRRCMTALEEILLENAKLQKDGELYLRADRGLDYGLVLMTMARIRKAGVTKFGLVAEPDLEE